jgi:hypothetical protein
MITPMRHSFMMCVPALIVSAAPVEASGFCRQDADIRRDQQEQRHVARHAGYEGWVFNSLPAETVVLRESGVSSKLRPIDSIIGSSEYWIARRSLSSGGHSADPLAGDDG